MSNRVSMLAGGGLLAAMTLGGCVVPDSTNPGLTITGVEVSDSGAQLDLRVENRSAYDLRLTGISWEVVYGPVPVGSGQWKGDSRPLPAATKGSTPLDAELEGSVIEFSRIASFDFPPVDPSAEEIELFGEMQFEGEIEIAPFRISAPVRQ